MEGLGDFFAALLSSDAARFPYVLIAVMGVCLWRLIIDERKSQIARNEQCERQLFVLERAFMKLMSVARANAGDKRQQFNAELNRIEDEMLHDLGRRRDDFQ